MIILTHGILILTQRETFLKILAQVIACARLCYPDVTPPWYLGVISLSAGVLDRLVKNNPGFSQI